MESDQPPLQEPDEQQTTAHTVRSYECHFCKRGFTNAQALGGHMNIHRKDKTKLKAAPNPLAELPSPARSQLSPASTATANPFSISHQGNWFSTTPQDEKKPLPLFDHSDTAVTRNMHQSGNPDHVDLELRLGHVEPQEEYSSSSLENKSTTTTRKFF
ncbi:hypothetical protein SSX86_026427 [Deinandra increscens subsp. villosa]|uniref:C2H2-type domain-containing protein n=1 Tax=Deinandra increscens subsp. villosa TaxID=3103831 RepID=A0AAP0CLC7_9ASTR